MPYTLKFAQLSINLVGQLIATTMLFLEFFPESPAMKLVKKILVHSVNVVGSITAVLELIDSNTMEREPQAHWVDLGPQALPPILDLADIGEFDAEGLIRHVRDIGEQAE
ncbi:hypothetical protein K439DRAFT_1616638 [Ramaria rubella]|nr:hypothetical protein K439DRAFT_1616638 [Ramaria rubella]